MQKVIVIPARLNSSRLSKKVLLDLEGKTVLERVYNQCEKVKNIDAIYIATDSKEVFQSASKYTSNVVMTSKNHQSGTDRIAEVVSSLDCDVVINVQGDEPFIDPSLIENLVNSLVIEDTNMTSVMCRIKKIEELKDPNIVKVTVDKNNNAIYFSRSMIPYPRDGSEELNDCSVVPDDLVFFRHLGIYGYKKDFLLKFLNIPESYLEKTEKLEQLRVLENGYKIKMIETSHESNGIDTREDYEKAKKLVNNL